MTKEINSEQLEAVGVSQTTTGIEQPGAVQRAATGVEGGDRISLMERLSNRYDNIRLGIGSGLRKMLEISPRINHGIEFVSKRRKGAKQILGAVSLASTIAGTGKFLQNHFFRSDKVNFPIQPALIITKRRR